MEGLFKEFESVGKEAWLDKIVTDAKGRSIADFEWKINEDISQSPFTHREDIKQHAASFGRNADSNFWSVGERVVVKDVSVANKQIISALENGVSTLFIRLENGLSRSDFEQIFKGVNFTYIQTYFEIINDILGKAILEDLIKFCNKHGQELSQVRGGLLSPQQNFSSPNRLFNDFQNVLPQFTFALVTTDTLYGYKETVIHEVGSLLLALNEVLASDNGYKRIFANINIGRSYLLNIAKVRAIHLLTNNLIKAYNADTKLIFNAEISAHSITQDENQNLIQFTSQAMAAVIGGVDCLTLPASDEFNGNEASDLRKRLSRNIQSIMHMESYMDKVIDPAAGSYYIEQLTDQIADRSWVYIQNNS